jgi:hypothetical protein
MGVKVRGTSCRRPGVRGRGAGFLVGVAQTAVRELLADLAASPPVAAK